ncbi:MAG: hypothetical protein JWN77_1495 [Frankiales bacterium]|jgi:uncharacterized protein (DUF427 family)|nr:hypothetical protein [Frankiales bacterium]
MVAGSQGVAAGMTIATWNGTVLAESDDTVVVESNRYFPRAAVKDGVLVDSPTTSVCPWKGTASYSSVVVDGQTNTDAAWYYPEPKDAAAQIRDRIAFWKGVDVTP